MSRGVLWSLGSPLTLLPLLVGLGGAVRSAQAAELGWEAPRGCPERAAIEARIEAALGEPLSRAADFALSATIAHDEDGKWLLTLVIAEPGVGGAAHIRRFTAEDCGELGDAAVAAVTFALTAGSQEGSANPSGRHADDSDGQPPGDAAVGAERPAPGRRGRGPQRAPGETRGQLAPPRGSTEGERRVAEAGPEVEGAAFFGSVELGALLDAGALPKATLGIAGRARVGYGMGSLRLGGFVLPEQRYTLEGSADPNAGGEFEFAGVAASLCARSSTPPGWLQLCGGLERGWLTGRGTGVDFTREARSMWWALLADAGYELPLGDAGLMGAIGVGAAVPLVRTRFTLREVGLAHQPSTLSWRAFLGLGWIFG